ncbi:hypothetical protein PAXINDRAFT_120233 [Paxillus involutus ATCC 200175]|uniref:Uncharacterized protein n=1 Tax=Paxillus involutus ATCC 200175 TaxID=664439 RepID=A0A0C9SZJ4_PAXIN|nr:hypothetical protein PAXINDRAFT_120233 [Paxillus involutus ATCC 200175]
MDRYRRPVPSLRQFFVSYAPDWIVTCALWMILYYISNHVTGFKRQFSLTDVTCVFVHFFTFSRHRS